MARYRTIDTSPRFLADRRRNRATARGFTTTGRYRCAGNKIDYEAALNDVALPVLAIEIRDDPVARAGAVHELLSKLRSCAIKRHRINGVLADAPWRRHFSWARQPDEVIAMIARWVRAQMESPPCRR
jgi:predicted alpha/beta hydrolase